MGSAVGWAWYYQTVPICIDCKLEVPELVKNRKRCRSCYTAYQAPYYLARYHRRRREAVELLGGQCSRCGSSERLEFDHKERSLKSAEIALLLTQGQNRLNEEVQKCQLLCHGCHVEKTRQETTVGHGGGTTGIRRCKCELCYAKKLEYNREWKRKKKLKS